MNQITRQPSRLCKKCGIEKSVSCFYEHRHECKTCVKRRSRKRTEKTASSREVIEKICCTCKERKSISDFNQAKHQTDGHSSYCKNCDRKQKSTPHARNLQNKAMAAKRERNPVLYKAQTMKSSAKIRAGHRNIEFDLTTEDILEKCCINCPVFGTPLDYRSSCLSIHSPTLDRFDITKGYTKDNIFVISFRANSIKRDASPDDLMRIALWAKNMEAGKK